MKFKDLKYLDIMKKFQIKILMKKIVININVKLIL